MIKDVINYFTDNPSSIISSLIILVLLIAGYFLVMRFLRKISRQDYLKDYGNLAKKFSLPLLLLLIAIFIQVLIAMIPEKYEKFSDAVTHATTIIYILTITWGLILGLGVLKYFIINKRDIETADNLSARKVYTQFTILERIIIFVLIIIAVAVALMTFEGIKRIGVSIFASAGIAGIIIGLAAQRAIGTVLAGVQIAITQPIRIDDVVIVENEWGRIEEIALTYVVVRIWDKRRLILPTTYFIEKPFQNWTRVSADLLGTVFIYTDYRVPVDEIRKELTRVLEDNDNWDGQVNVVQVTDMKEQTMEVRALMSTEDSGKGWELRVHVREKLIEFLQKNYPESLPRTRINIDHIPEMNIAGVKGIKE